MPSFKLGGSRAANPEGQMPLVEHIRELRNRLIKVLIGLVAGMVVAFVFLDPIMEFMRAPYCEAVSDGGPCKLFVFGVLEPFTFRLKIAFIVGMVAASPIWVYQLWAFITPGMHSSERRYTLGFVLLGVPFFIGGVLLAYVTLDKGLSLFLGFLTSGMELNLKAGQYLTYLTVIMLIFGISFELPLLVTMLNFAGVLSHERLAHWRRWIVFGVCVFAAVATPSQDPFTMLALAIPMAILMEIATFIAKVHDRRKARREANSAYAGLGDDEASPLDLDDAGGGSSYDSGTPRDGDSHDGDSYDSDSYDSDSHDSDSHDRDIEKQ